MNERQLNTMIIPVVVLSLGMLALGWLAHSTIVENKHLTRDLSYYNSTYLRMQGGTSLWAGSKGASITYELRSFDGGHSWYAVEQVGDVLKIKGEAETVYPGLMATLKSWDDLIAKIKRDGPIQVTNPSDLKFLKAAGFTITTNK